MGLAATAVPSETLAGAATAYLAGSCDALTAGRLVLSRVRAESGQAEEELAVSYTEEGFSIGFNARYMLDVASQIEGDEAQFHFADAASPALVTDSGDNDALYVLMPLRV